MIEEITRIISGTATIIIPPEWERFREVYLYSDVVRDPTNKYLNLNYTPPKSRYATVTVLAKGGYVRKDIPIEFEQQRVKLFALQTSQNFLAQICALDNVLDSIANLAAALPDVFPISVNNGIEDFGYEAVDFDRCVLTCYADTALRIVLQGIPLEQCDPTDGLPSPPPLPPPPPDKVPPGTPVEITPPQEFEPEELNQPFPGDDDGDEEFEFPFGDECSKYICTSAITTTTNGRQVRSEAVYGEIRAFFYNPSGGPSGNSRDAIILDCRGLAEFEGNPLPCGDEVSFVWQDAAPEEFVSAEIINIVPID
jgi:hypothetical protein